MFNNKIANIILAFIISIGLWSYVVYAVNPIQKETFRNIPVQLVNEQALNERGLAVANATDIAVDAAVEGSRKVLASMDSGSFTATADVSQCVAGTNSVVVDIKTNKNAELASGSIVTVQINVEQLVTESRDIKVEYTGQAGSDREIEAELTGDKTVKVSGAASLVAGVSYVSANVDISKIETENQAMTAKLEAVDSSGSAVDNISLSQETAEVRVSIYSTKKVPLVVNIAGQPPAGYRYEGIKTENNILLRGSKATLESISSVSAEYIDISGLTATTEVKLSLILPEGVELSSKAKQPVAEVYIEGEASSSVSIKSSNVAIRNLDEDTYDARIISGNISISVAGVENAAESDFTLSINLRGLDAGEHEVPLTVKYKGNGSVTSAPDTVTVRISEKE